MKTKRCGRCKSHKPLDAFNNDKSRKDGKHPTCKACKRAYTQSAKGKAARQRWVDGGGLERNRALSRLPHGATRLYETQQH